MKAWLKGGIIGLVILLIYDLISLFFIGYEPCAVLTQCVGESCWNCIFLGPFFAIILGFIIGALIGLIVQKVKK